MVSQNFARCSTSALNKRCLISELSVHKEVKNEKQPSFEYEYRIFVLFVLFEIKVTLQKEIEKIMNKGARKANELYVHTEEVILKLV